MEQFVFEQIVHPVMRVLTDHITKHLGYVACSTKHVNHLRNKMKVLEETSADVKKQMDGNKINFKEIPTGVSDWLNDVENLKEKVQSISSDDMGCLNIKMRYQAGRKACKDIAMIEELITKHLGFNWTDAPVPTGLVDFNPASSSTAIPSSSDEGFMSRDKPFKDALRLLQLDTDESQVIALCGMGGVGKTTMMKQLETVANEMKMFYMIVNVVIGSSPNMLSIQNDISVRIGGEGLREKTEEGCAGSLCKKFKVLLEDGKKKILVILDDVWQNINLENIGITSPLPKGLKLLLTSRDSNICSQIAACVGSTIQVVKVDVLKETEAQILFSQFSGVSQENHKDKYLIGCDIVKACGNLPLAIKLIASTLKSEDDMYKWNTTLDRFKNRVLDDKVEEIVRISYEYIKKDEDKKIFLHCGLFPEDYDIPIEDLMRHAWGLKLFKNVSTIRKARDRTNTCVNDLIKANLLINSDQVGCVKMHDLVLAFVLTEVSKGDHDWIINHGDVSKWDRDEMSESSKRISLTCKGMSEFPIKYRYPNMSLLQLMYGDLSLIFPEDYYDKMENLKVIAYYDMRYPLPPRSLECSTNLKSLCLYKCSLVFDLSSIGDLVNLEVLSFADSDISNLPSTLGNLRKLKLLDLTGCDNLHIDVGVFKKLESLEELYMRVSGTKAISFTDASFEELMMLSSQLFALEMEFVSRKSQLKDVCFTKLDKFIISVGRPLKNVSYASKNTLELVTNRSSDLLDCKISELFMKTEKLTLEVKDMIGLENISFHSLDRSTFSFISDLKVSKCKDLKYLFPISVATGLGKLEKLKISSCDNLEALIHDYGSEINSRYEMIKFGELKFMSLERLPKLVSLFQVENAVELPQLVEVEVSECEYLKYLFTITVATGLRKLESLEVSSCYNLEALVHDYGSEINNRYEMIKFGELKFMSLERLPKLVSLFQVENVVELPQLVELNVEELPYFTSIFAVMNNYSAFLHSQVIIPELKILKIKSMRNLVRIWACSSDVEVDSISMLRVIEVEGCDSLVSLFPTNPIRLVNHLEELDVSECGSIEVIFNIDLESCVSEVERLSNSSLKSIEVSYLKNLREVWRIKCDENKSSSICSFDAIESIKIEKCKGFRKIFTSTNVKFYMQALRELRIYRSGESGRNMELAEYRQHEETNVSSGEENISTVAFPSSLLHSFHNLNDLRLTASKGVEVVFGIESGTTTNNQQPLLPSLQTLHLRNLGDMSHVWKWNKFLILQKQHTPSSFHNLTTIELFGCDRIRYLFSPLMAKLLSNLKTIDMSWCNSMEEIVSNRDDDKDEETTATTLYETTTATLFPHLHSLYLYVMDALEQLGGGGAGVRDEITLSEVNTIVSWSLCQYPREIDIGSCHELSSVIPSYAVGQMQNLQILRVKECNKLVEVFETQGITNNSGFGSPTDIDDGSVGTTLAIPRLENLNVPRLSNLKKLEIESCCLLPHVFTFSTIESLKQLEELVIIECEAMEAIVKNEIEEQRKVVVFPHLKSIKLRCLENLKGFFLGMDIGFEWPLLETVVIYECPQMVVFTSGKSIARKLKYIHTSLGKHILDEGGLNFDLTTELQQMQIPCTDSTSVCSSFSKPFPAWYFRNLIELHLTYKESDICHKSLVSSNDMPQLQKLERILLEKYWSPVEVIFEVEAKEGVDSESQTIVEIPNLRQLELKNVYLLKYIWKRNHTVLLPNLTTMSIDGCDHITYVITSSMVGSLQQLQHLHVGSCDEMKEVVKVEEENFECDAKAKKIVLPCLKSLKLDNLHSLEGFYLGTDDFSLPSLHTLEITNCSELKVFSRGHVATPALQVFDTSFGRFYEREDINSSMEAVAKMYEERKNRKEEEAAKETPQHESTSNN